MRETIRNAINLMHGKSRACKAALTALELTGSLRFQSGIRGNGPVALRRVFDRLMLIVNRLGSRIEVAVKFRQKPAGRHAAAAQ